VLNGRAVIRLEVPGILTHRDVALRTVSAACKLVRGKPGGARPDANFSLHVVSAVGEAFNNIALHGYGGRLSDIIRVEIDVGDDAITIAIHDFGSSFDPAAAVPPDLDTLPESGLGVYIIRSFMDTVDYRPGRPNVLTLTKHIN